MQVVRHYAQLSAVRDINDGNKMQKIKNAIIQKFASMAKSDSIFQSMFDMKHVLGIGSFGIVFAAKVKKDLSGADLVSAQERKLQEDPNVKIEGYSKFKTYLHEHKLKCGSDVAIKFEAIFERRRHKFHLQRELHVLIELFSHYGRDLEGFAKPYQFGCIGNDTFTDADQYGMTGKYYTHHYLVMQLLGESMRKQLENVSPEKPLKPSERLPLEFVMDLAVQLITRLKALHQDPILLTHNDLKLDQLVMGNDENSSVLYLVDFGLANKYKNYTMLRCGNRRYDSHLRHMGVHTPLTDLESAGYVIARLLHNSFPWDGAGTDDRTRQQQQRPQQQQQQHGISHLKQELWCFIERVYKGRSSRSRDPSWLNDFFALRCDDKGNGGRQLLRFMCIISGYYNIDAKLPASDIDYEKLKRCFIL